MSGEIITRAQLLDQLIPAFEAVPEIYAVWEGGSAAFGRIDQYSDLDLHVVVEDEHVGEVYVIAETVLGRLSTFDLIYEVPQPTWHGHAQKFYRLKDAGEYLLVDLAVMKLSNPNRFLERELHGDAQVFFDKQEIVRSTNIDRDYLSKKLQERIEDLVPRFDMFQGMVTKEILRENPLDALTFYQGLTLRPLVELLRIKYTPERYQFSLRYLYYDFPQEVVEQIEALAFVRDLDDLKVKHRQAVSWFKQESHALANQYRAKINLRLGSE